MAEENNGEWTKGALLTHIITLIEANDKRYADRLEDIEEKLKTSHSELKEYLCDKIEAQSESIKIAMVASKEAIVKAENANEKRFESVNEFRNTLKDQQAGLIPRTEYDAGHMALGEKVNALKERFDKFETANLASKEVKLEAKKGIQDWMGYILFAMTLIGFVAVQLTQCGVVK